MMDTALSLPGPSSIRFAKTPGPIKVAGGTGRGLRSRKVLDGGTEIAIVAIGKLLLPAYRAALEVANEGISVTLWDPRCIRPLDPEMIADLSQQTVVLTFEDGFVNGGAGDYISRAIKQVNSQIDVRNYGIPLEFIPQGDPDEILSSVGLDVDGITSKIREAFKSHLLDGVADQIPLQ